MDQTGYLVKQAQHSLRLIMDQALKTLDLTLPQYNALAYIDSDEGISNAELARQAFVTPQTMHRVIVGLEKRALIERTAHPHLDRQQQIFLTEAGQRLLVNAHGVVESIETQSLAQMSEEDIQLFRRMLKKYLAALHNIEA